MMMNVLERSFHTQVFHERDRRLFSDFEMRGIEVVRDRVRTSGAPLVVVKALCESDMLLELLDAFPGSRAIWMVRDFADVVNSQMASWQGEPEVIAGVLRQDPTFGWKGRNVSEATRELLQRLCGSDLDEPSAWGAFWYLRNIRYFEQELDRDPRVLLVRYESLVLEPATVFRSVFGFFGIPARPWHYRIVRASSIRKRPPPAISPAIQALCQELTQRFDRLDDTGPDADGVADAGIGLTGS